MSWILESLLNNRERIRETGDIDSDEFNDLLIVEKKIDELRQVGKLDDEDLAILFSSISSDYKVDERSESEKKVLYQKKTKLCEKLAYYLGGYFTDDGYLDYMQKKYKLSDTQIENLRRFMQSKYRNKIMRKPITNE
jgi:hypothetical protein